MERMRLLFVLLAVAARISPQTPVLDDLLKKVAESYTNLKNYQFEVHVNRSINSPGRYVAPEESRVILAVAAPDRLHFEIRAPLNQQITVSDGATTWTYLPQFKQYTKEDGAPSEAADAEDTEADESQYPVALARFQLINRFQNLAPEAKSIQLLPEEEIEVGGEKIRCVVLQIAGETRRVDASASTGSRAIVDRSQALPGFEIGSENEEEYSQSLLSVTETWEWTRARTDQEPEAGLFAFQPPRGVKLVQVLDTPFKQADWRGRAASDFTLKSLDREDVSLSSLRGKVVLMTFWASWCGPCRKELPVLVNLESELGGRGLVVLGINGERGGAARNFLQNRGLALRTLSDSRRAVNKLYGVHSIPTLLVLDRGGTVVGQYRGGVPENMIRASLKQAGVE